MTENDRKLFDWIYDQFQKKDKIIEKYENIIAYPALEEVSGIYEISGFICDYFFKKDIYDDSFPGEK